MIHIHFWLLLWFLLASWALCIAFGVLLSRRMIVTTTQLYAALWHDVQAAKQMEARAKSELQDLKAKIEEKASKILH